MVKYIGYIAAVLTSTSFLPQAIKTIKTKDTESISLWMYLMFVLGVVLWLVYGLFLKDMPLIAANTVTLIFSGSILKIKLENYASDKISKKEKKLKEKKL